MNIFRKLFANDLSPGFIAGTCVMESRSFALETAEELKGIFKTLGLLFRHKSSFDKANRSSLISYRGVGMKEGLFIFAEVKEKMGVFVLTDVHEARRLILLPKWWMFFKPLHFSAVKPILSLLLQRPASRATQKGSVSCILGHEKRDQKSLPSRT